nr:uncharacterized protein LOC494383 [Ciona intestinalis]|eukprot:XP_026690106.1 uncharacterized protein LOC494383 [Ciona intestinalis]
MLMLMAAARNLYQDISMGMSPTTTSFPHDSRYRDISESVLGIVGMGRIGYKIAERAKAFDMDILYHNRNQRSSIVEEAVGAQYYKTLNQMLPLCDHVIITVPLNSGTYRMIGAKQFRLMKPTCVFVNIARGGIVDHDALTEALETKKIYYAALDVTDPEPLPRNHPLLQLNNCIITPHNASATFRVRSKMLQKAIDNILAAINDEPLPSGVEF